MLSGADVAPLSSSLAVGKGAEELSSAEVSDMGLSAALIKGKL